MNIVIVGSGYVGLVNGAGLASLGHKVVCVDQSEQRVKAILSGQAPFHEPGLPELIAGDLAAGTLTATTDLASSVKNADMTMIAVGTPFGNDAIDLAQVKAAATEIGEALKGSSDYHVVVVKSTVVPGTTGEVVRAAVEAASGRRSGKSLGFCMHPEFLREGSAVEDFMTPDRIVIGSDDVKASQAVASLYERHFSCPVIQCSLVNAELIKYASNSLLATLVSFSNEIANICEAVPEADSETVLDGVRLDRRWTPIVEGKPVRPGIHAFLKAGSGFGGSCLPKDVKAITAYARQQKVEPSVLQSVLDVNAQRPGNVLTLLERRLGTFSGKRLALLGLAFKAGTDDLRDSPALVLLEKLADKGSSVIAFDPLVPELPNGPSVAMAKSAEEALSAADAAIIATACPEFLELDWQKAAQEMTAPVVLDARGALAGMTIPDIVEYMPIGRLS